MKKCPGCGYLWADDYAGTCMECGKALGSVSAPQDLNFRYASQIAQGRREGDAEVSLKRGRYDGVKIPDAVLDRARGMLVQKEEVVYEVED